MARYNRDNNYVAFLLQLFGSIILLFLAFFGAAEMQMLVPGGTAAQVITHILFSTAVISSIVLLLISLSYLTISKFKYAKYAMCTTFVASFALLAIVAGNNSLFYEGLVGFLVSLAGASLAETGR